jgi:hypothetical protein
MTMEWNLMKRKMKEESPRPRSARFGEPSDYFRSLHAKSLVHTEPGLDLSDTEEGDLLSVFEASRLSPKTKLTKKSLSSSLLMT